MEETLFSWKFSNLRQEGLKSIQFFFVEDNTKNVDLNFELCNIYFFIIYSFYALWLVGSVFTFDYFG